MTLVALVAILIILFVIVRFYASPSAMTNPQVSVGGFTTKNFDICPRSLAIFNEMKAAGVGPGMLKRFAMLEDTFLGYERDIVCNGARLVMQASALSQEIQSSFPAWNFGYHAVHLEQMKNPDRTVNPNLVCRAR